MIIHIEICDICRRVMRGVPTIGYSSGGHRWDVGPCCEKKRFTIVQGAATEQTLRARIEALITTELHLLREQT